MSELFNFLTFPLGLPIEPFWSYVIMLIVGVAAYKIAYYAVGKMYGKGEIQGKSEGSAWHWIIRMLVFVVIWAVLYDVIAVVKFFVEYPSMLMIIPTIIMTGFLCKEVVGLMRDIKQWRNDRNA